MNKAEARAFRKKIEKAASFQSDEDALNSKELFEHWRARIGTWATTGERLWWDERLWKVLQPHTIQEDWTPDATPSLYVEVSIVEWPEWVQPTGAQDAYNRGDKVTFEGQHYISLIDGNVYSPAAYPAGWELQP